MNLAIQSSASSADEIRESGRAFQSLIKSGEETTFINICISNRSLKCHRVLGIRSSVGILALPLRPFSGKAKIYFYSTFWKCLNL